MPAVVACLIMGVAGCTGQANGPASSSTTVSPSNIDQGSAQQAGVDLNNQPKPVATGRIPALVDGDANATLDVAFYGLRRQGKVLVATYSFTVRAAVARRSSLHKFLGRNLWWPYLVDNTNLTRHDVLVGGGTRAMTDPVSGADFGTGQTFYAYAMFAAPPESVNVMDVFIVTGLPVVTAVPIT